MNPQEQRQQAQKPRKNDKPRRPRPDDTGRQVKTALRCGRFDEAHDLTHRKAG